MPKSRTSVPTKPARTTRPKPGAATAPRPVGASDRPALPATALAVRALLTANAGLTIAELAARAELSRSTVSKATNTLETAGAARREPGSRQGIERTPDLWFAITPSPMPGHEQESVPPSTGSNTERETSEPDAAAADANEPSLEAGTGEASTPETTADTAEPAPSRAPNPAEEYGAANGGDEQRPGAEPAASAPGEPQTAEPATVPAHTGEPAESAEAGQSEPAQIGAAQVDTASEPISTVAAASTSQPLGKGGLRALVDAHLEAHPEQHFTPSQLGKALGRSSGAISNALDKLVELHRAELTCPKPRRFQHRSA